MKDIDPRAACIMASEIIGAITPAVTTEMANKIVRVLNGHPGADGAVALAYALCQIARTMDDDEFALFCAATVVVASQVRKTALERHPGAGAGPH